MNIKEHLQKYVYEGLCRLESYDGIEGVLFLDEMEWMPLRDVGYNQEFGYFLIKDFPNQPNEITDYK